ncbi:MAG TPA: PEGA domain-containing protein [Candidatus Gracilibacteria bacterium]|nr:PEGA domain-containing protein [Candidatus Gracilibacteria bacterium]
MNEEARKKLYMWILITAAVIGLLFVLWAIFLNRGTLTIQGDAPFSVNVQALQNENCLESPCSIELAPGDYNISIQKPGFRTIERTVQVPINGEHIEEVSFEFIPVIQKVGVEADVKAFPEVSVVVPELGDTPLFYEENYITYLAYDDATKRQTLYLRGITEDSLTEPQVTTSFIRTIDEYTIIPNIEQANSIALIDQSGDEDAVYVVNMTEKSRNNIFSMAFIKDLKWINAQKVLIEAQAEGDTGTSIYWYNLESGESKKLNLKTSLNNIAVLDQTTVIAATNQDVTGVAAVSGTNGALITLGEAPATPNIAIAGLTEGPQLSFIRYDLALNEARLITIDSNFSYADKIKLGRDQKSVMFLVNGEVYELKFEA